VHVPYKGSSPMLTALMGGEVDMGFDSIATALPHVRAGRLKALAVSGDSRTPLAPDLPTVAQAGVPGFGYTSYFALVAPATTPANVLDRLSRELLVAVSSADIRDRLQGLGLESFPLSASESVVLLRKERAMWASIVAAARITVE